MGLDLTRSGPKSAVRLSRAERAKQHVDVECDARLYRRYARDSKACDNKGVSRCTEECAMTNTNNTVEKYLVVYCTVVDYVYEYGSEYEYEY